MNTCRSGCKFRNKTKWFKNQTKVQSPVKEELCITIHENIQILKLKCMKLKNKFLRWIWWVVDHPAYLILSTIFKHICISERYHLVLLFWKKLYTSESVFFTDTAIIYMELYVSVESPFFYFKIGFFLSDSWEIT